MKHEQLIILATTPTPAVGKDIYQSLDKSDQFRLRKNPNLSLSQDWQSSRFLKKQASNHTLSLSHKKGHAALLMSTQASVICGGIDLEYIQQRDFIALSELFCNKLELQWLKRQEELSHAFYLLWTLKEALIKAHHASLADIRKFPLITKTNLSEEILTIPTINHVALKGLSFQPAPDWIISAVYPAKLSKEIELTFQGYGLWQNHQLTKNNSLRFGSSIV